MAIFQHALFALSFLSVFASLVAISRFLGKTLREHGYDISKLILIGLPDQQRDSSTNTAKTLRMSQSDLTKPLAIAFAGLTTVFLYYRFSNSSSAPSHLLRLSSIN